MLASTGLHQKLPRQGVHFSVPENLREVITARLEDLPRDTRELLAVASVLGREFDLPCLAALGTVHPTMTAAALEPALSAGIIESLAPERFWFKHVLFREVLYAEHSTVSRALLHRSARDYLEHRYGDDPQPYLSQLAHHSFEAAQADREGKAVYYCRQAADSAIARRAYNEASGLFECALQAAELNPGPDSWERFDLLMGLGQAQYLAGQMNAATTTLMKAAIHAYTRRDWARLAESLFRFQHVCQQCGLRHVSSVPLHLAVLENLSPGSEALRARVLASAAKAYRTAGDPQNAARVFHQSLALARESSDPELLLSCLLKGNWVIGRAPEGTRAGLDVALEALALARNQGHRAAELDALTDIIFQLCDLGNIEELERRLLTLKSLAKQVRQPHFLNNAIGFETALAILRGHWMRALRGARETMQQVPLLGVLGLQGRVAFQMFAIHRALGSLQEQADLVDQIVDTDGSSGFWLPGQVLLHCELGQHQRARTALGRLGDLHQLPRDDLYLIALVYLAEACTSLHDVNRCKQLYGLLRPYRGLNVTIAGTLMLGAASGYLASLATTTGQTREARTLYEQAIGMNASMGADPSLARTMVDYASLLLSTGRQQDQVKARSLLDQALPITRRLAMQPLQRAIEQLDSKLTLGSLSRRETEVLELVASGYSNDNISESLHISHSTVATHMRNILRKTGACNRTEAVDYGRRIGLINRYE